MTNYCTVRFKRGTGLGNKLFPWARCIIFSKQHQIPMLMPNWFHLRKGPLLKGGINYNTALRKILLHNNFQNKGVYIGGLKKIKILLNALTITEGGEIIQNGQDKLFLFSGDGAFFVGLHQYQAQIKASLENDVNSRLKHLINETEVPPIILNIRRGKDFNDVELKSDYFNKGTVRTPLSWFIETLKQIRGGQHGDTPALIISEGSENDLKEILRLPNVTLSNSPAAITDLLLLSKAKVILGSGGSSFSAWGSFLSKAITLTIPGQSLQWFNVSDDVSQHIVTTYDPDHINTQLLDKIWAKLTNH